MSSRDVLVSGKKEATAGVNAFIGYKGIILSGKREGKAEGQREAIGEAIGASERAITALPRTAAGYTTMAFSALRFHRSGLK